MSFVFNLAVNLSSLITRLHTSEFCKGQEAMLFFASSEKFTRIHIGGVVLFLYCHMALLHANLDACSHTPTGRLRCVLHVEIRVSAARGCWVTCALYMYRNECQACCTDKRLYEHAHLLCFG